MDTTDPSQQFFETEIFKVKKATAGKNTHSNSVIAPRQPEEAFKEKSFFGTPPARSIYSRTQNQRKSKTLNNKNWVTVIGFNFTVLEDIIDYFSQFGLILRYNDTPGNIIYMEFDTPENAQKAIQASQFGPILINNSYAVTVAAGRLKPQYANEEQPISKSSLDDEQIPIAVEPIEKKSIFDRLFGF